MPRGDEGNRKRGEQRQFLAGVSLSLWACCPRRARGVQRSPHPSAKRTPGPECENDTTAPPAAHAPALPSIGAIGIRVVEGTSGEHRTGRGAYTPLKTDRTTHRAIAALVQVNTPTRTTLAPSLKDNVRGPGVGAAIAPWKGRWRDRSFCANTADGALARLARPAERAGGRRAGRRDRPRSTAS